MIYEPEFKPTCIWCNAEWSDENVNFENAYMSAGCETCGHGSEGSAQLVIKCHECKKVIYTKEGKLG